MAPNKQDKFNKKKAEQVEQKSLEQYTRMVSSDQSQENITSGTITFPQKERKQSKGEEIRIREKLRLLNVINEYRDAINGDPKLDIILEAIKIYAKSDVTASGGDYLMESKAVNAIQKALKAYQKELDKKALDAEHDTLTDYARQRVVASLITQLEYNTGGNLVLPDPKGLNRDKREKGAYYVDGTKAPFAPKSGKYMVDKKYTDRPLFPHEPCANDISQGYLGDCYYVASLAEIADRHPEKIRDAMQDNGDGTVTVRFFATQKGKDNKYSYKPVYVTVEKVVPSDFPYSNPQYAQDSMWVQTMERAYAASGLHVYTHTNEAEKLGLYDEKEALHQLPVPENIEQMYEDIKNKLVPMPSHDECPWLVDKKGNLHPYEASYASVRGGYGHFAMQALLGPEYVPATYKFSSERENFLTYDKDSKKRYIADDLALAAFDDMFLESKTGESRREMINLRNDYPHRIMSILATAYEKIMDQPCPRDDMNMIDTTNYPQLLDFLNDLEVVKDYIKNITDDVKVFGDAFKERISDKEHGLEAYIKNLAKEREEGSKDIDPEHKIDYEKFMDGIGKMLTERLLKINDKYAEYPKYSGQYNGLEKELLKRVQESKNNGRMMLCDTGRVEDGTDISFGLRKTHQYTAIDSIKRTVNGKELWFVRLRNPHAANVMKYTVENGTMVPSPSESDEQGYFDIELSDFAKNFSEFIYGEPAEELALEIEQQEPDKEQIISNEDPEKVQVISNEDPDIVQVISNEDPEPVIEINTQVLEEENDTVLTDDEFKSMDEEIKRLHAYDRALEDIQKALKATDSGASKDSPQYIALKKSIYDVRKDLAGFNGKADLKTAMNKLLVASTNYSNHVKDTPKSGSRRANRVEINNAIGKLIEMEGQGVKDPKATLRDDLAEKMLSSAESHLANSNKQADRDKLAVLQNPQQRKQKKDSLLADNKLERVAGSDFVSLYKTMKQPAVTIAKMAEKADKIVPPKESKEEHQKKVLKGLY